MNDRKALKQERLDIIKDIDRLKERLKDNYKQQCLLCDNEQWFRETYEYRFGKDSLIGRIHWKSFFKDSDHPKDESKGVWVERRKIVKIDGEWVI